MDRMEKTRALRAETAVHYNCAQAVLVPYAAEMGITEEQAYQLGAHFGAGMRHGSTCGAITGALMVLGMMGYEDQAARAILNGVREKHNGVLDCAHLLQANKATGISGKVHCDGMVYELVEAVEAVLKG